MYSRYKRNENRTGGGGKKREKKLIGLRTPVTGGAALWRDNRKVKPTPKFSILDLQLRGEQGIHVNYFILKAKDNSLMTSG